MKKLILVLLAVLCVGVAARFLHRFLADEETWRTNKAVKMAVLRQAEWHVKEAESFRGYVTDSKSKIAASIIVADMNQAAQDEVIDAKNALLRLYEDKGRSLNVEEAAQIAQWQKDVAAWKAVNISP